MLKEALQYMAEIGEEKAKRIIRTDAEPKHVYYLREVNGELKKVAAEPEPSNHTAYSLQAIVAKAVENPAESEIWYGPHHVATRYGVDLRDRTTLNMSYTDPIRQLQQWKETARAMTQAEIVRVLRVTFRDSLAQAGNLVEVLRKVKFTAGSTTDGEVGHGKASLGKQIVGEVTGTGIIPEYVTFNCPVYTNACFKAIRASVGCALEPDAATGTFRVIPLPGELESAIEKATAEVYTFIGAEFKDFEKEGATATSDIPVYYGAP